METCKMMEYIIGQLPHELYSSNSAQLHYFAASTCIYSSVIQENYVVAYSIDRFIDKKRIYGVKYKGIFIGIRKYRKGNFALVHADI